MTIEERYKMILDFYEEGKEPLAIKIRAFLRQIRRVLYEYRNNSRMDRIRRD